MIYLDNFATTPVDPRVIEFYHEALKLNFGNPSSVDHDLGKAADNTVTQSRRKISDLLNCQPAEITFTSGATESISLFLQGYLLAKKPSVNRLLRVLSSPVEHPAVIENLQYLKNIGFIELEWLKVDEQGRVDIAEVEKKCKPAVDLICVMAVNNELGNIYPINDIARLATEHNAVYFCDATQAIGKTEISLSSLPETVLVFSGHKFYAPKGIGVLIADRSLSIKPLFYGGGQQRGLRPGTVNAPLIATLAYALEIAASEMHSDQIRIKTLRDALQHRLAVAIPELMVNGDSQNRVSGALHVSIPGKSNKQFIAGFRHQLCISTGAACSSGSERPSYVLKAMQLAEPLIEGAMRISLGRFTVDNDVNAAAKIIIDAIR